jgi:dipeptidyl-peptidase-4
MATEKSPIERHLYRAKLDGSSLNRLTSESGTHVVSFSPDLKYYLDQHSNLTSMPTLSLHRNDGTAIDTLAASRPELLNQFNLQYPVVTTVPTPDGLSLPCMLTRPSDFDSSNKYPVILEVYGGPSAPIVTDAWRGQATLLDQILLDQGCVLMSCDNRSSATVSKTEAVKVKGQLWGEVELTDLLAAVHWLKEQPWVDPARIGIWGWSGGGTYTILAMTHTTEFKAGIAGAPGTDWRYYDTKYTEAYMKLPEENAEGYATTSLVNAAKNLHGRLLLMHGASDDNVHIQHSWAFVVELVKAGKTLDMMIYPLQKHTFEDKPSQIHRRKTMNEFWIRNL